MLAKDLNQKLRNPANNFILKWLSTSKNIMKHETVKLNFEWAKILFREIQCTSKWNTSKLICIILND